jgi:signal transduction histidine kinase
MHKLLQRQLRQARQASTTGEMNLDALLELIDAAYFEVDRERRYTAHAHQVMRDEQMALISTQTEIEAVRARAAAEAEALKHERLSLIGRLTSSVAHELRNPLSTIRNTVHVIGQIAEAGGVDVARPLARCQRTVDRCDGIVRDLLDFASDRELHPMSMRLDTWLDEILPDLKLSDQITLDCRFGASGAVVQVDAERMRCVIGNVMDNAVRAMLDAPDLPERRITVTTSQGATAEIVIADTGPGMSEEVLARAFDPLFSTYPFGTGLGLPTVKQIVEMHGGEIAIDSAPGKGTRVTIRLMLAVAKTQKAG